jgi:DNA-binding GntR family transcriptional regulator
MIIEHSDLTTKVYRWLRDQILHHVFLPGNKLDVQQLADDLGVSRTPVKDAINRLTAEGLVVLRSRRGTYVARLTPAALHDLFDARLMIETWAAQALTPEQLASVASTIRDLFTRADRIITPGDAAHFDYPAFYALDTALHETLVRLAGNAILVEMHRTVIARAGVGRMYFPGDVEIWLRSLAAHEEHRAIAKAVAAGDVTALLASVRAHIRASRAHTTMLLDRFEGAAQFRALASAADG